MKKKNENPPAAQQQHSTAQYNKLLKGQNEEEWKSTSSTIQHSTALSTTASSLWTSELLIDNDGAYDVVEIRVMVHFYHSEDDVVGDYYQVYL